MGFPPGETAPDAVGPAPVTDGPVAEHLAVFEYGHERLTEALGDLDVHAPARPGNASPGPGG